MTKDKHNICHVKTFEEIYNTYAKDIRRFLFFKTQNVNKSEDLMQDVFIKLWDNCDKVDYNKVKSYIFTVANNMFLNQVKHEKVVRSYNQQKQKEKTDISPEYIMLEKEFMAKLEATITNLPQKQREVFLMNRIEKKKYKEIAEELKISVKAVEKRMHQALITMRETIGKI